MSDRNKNKTKEELIAEIESLRRDIESIKQVEDALKETKEKFRAIFDNATDGMLLADMENKRFHEANKTICRMLGYSLKEIKNMGVKDIHPEQKLPYVIEQFERQAREEISLARDIPVRRKDGSVFYADINSSPITLAGKEYLLGIFRDITERKQLEEALRVQSRRFEAFFENTITPLAFLDKDFNFIRVNKAYADADEKEISYFPGRNHFDIYPSDAKILFEEVVRTKTPFQVFARPFIYTDHPEWGVTYWDWTLVPILDKNGEVEFLVFSLVDVTKGKKTEELIINILESIDESFVVIDKDYKILSANKAYLSSVNRPIEEVMGRHCYELSHNVYKPCCEMGLGDCPVNLAFMTGEHHETVHTHHDKEGNPTYVETKAYPQKDSSGEVVSVIEIIVNITEKRKLEEQLRQAQKMEAIGQLTGGIAHDFNNILNTIIGYGSLMQTKMKEDDPFRVNVEQILESAERAADLTHSLLAFSRKQIMNLKPVDMNEVSNKMEKLLLRLIGEDIELKTILSGEKLTVMADSGQIEQVLMNLATNARDVMPKGGSLTISSELVEIDEGFVKAHGYGEPGRYALISVTDTGTGMDEETRKKIFEPFFTTKEVGKGTGLGLAMVYGIIKQHNGYINVYSEPGKGTTFRIYLPIIKAKIEEVREPVSAAPLQGGTETILAAEDDAALRKLTRTVLEAYGYNVIMAEDGEDAVNKFKENKEKIQLCILDMIMPRKSGKEAYDEIRKIQPDIKVLFASGYTADKIHKEKMIEEGLEFILKPVSPKDLLKKVREMLDK